MKIQWTKAAKEKYVEIIDFLEDNWGESVLKSFRKKIRKSLNTIIKNPKAAPISNKLGLRKIVVTKHNLIIYNFNEKELTVVILIDTRTDHKY